MTSQKQQLNEQKMINHLSTVGVASRKIHVTARFEAK